MRFKIFPQNNNLLQDYYSCSMVIISPLQFTTEHRLFLLHPTLIDFGFSHPAPASFLAQIDTPIG